MDILEHRFADDFFEEIRNTPELSVETAQEHLLICIQGRGESLEERSQHMLCVQYGLSRTKSLICDCFEGWALLRSEFVENSDEPFMLLRAQAALLCADGCHFYSPWVKHSSDLKRGTSYFFEKAVEFCNGAKRHERRKMIREFRSPMEYVAVGKVLDEIKKHAEATLGLPEETIPNASCVREFNEQIITQHYHHMMIAQQRMPREYYDEIFTLSALNGGSFNRTSKLKASQIEEVKALPTDPNLIMLIVFDVDTLRMSMGNDRESLIRIFRVNERRLQKGSRGALKQVKVFKCGNHLVTNPDMCICVGAIAMACLEPYTFQSGVELVQPATRPSKVWLPIKKQTDQFPLLQSFLSMMGLETFEKAPAYAQTYVGSKNWFMCLTEGNWEMMGIEKDEAPYFHDAAHGIQCQCCGKIGPCLQQCPCGKVYFCGSDCQNSGWKDHKQIHKKAMSRMKR